MMIIYVILGWILVPLLYEFLNRQKERFSDKITHLVTGWPAWVINALLCFAVALIVMFLPGGWKISLSNLFLLGCVIYFGNAAFFNTIVKPLMRKANLEKYAGSYGGTA